MNGSGLALISILVIALLAVAVGTTQIQAQKDAEYQAIMEQRNKAVEIASASDVIRETAIAEKDNAQKMAKDLQTQAGNLQAQIETLNSEKASLQSEKDNLQSQFTALQSEKEGLQSQFTALQSEKGTLQSQYNTLQSDKNTLQSQYTTLQSMFTTVQSEKDSLQSQNTYLKTINADLQKKASMQQTFISFPQLFGSSKEPIATTGNTDQKALCVIVPTGENAIPWALSLALGMGLVVMAGGVGYAVYTQDPNRKYTIRLTHDQMREFARYQRERGKRAV